MTRFSIIGPSGYIAGRHIESIRKLNGKIISYLDIQKCHDLSPSIEYFDNEKDYFKSFKTNKPDYCVICSPNYLHASQAAEALKNGVNVICEKPICISKKELQELTVLDKSLPNGLYSIMQLRLHPVLKEIRKLLKTSEYPVSSKITFITPRDEDYLNSWKTNPKYSGGIIFNLGIHYFDLLIKVFGKPIKTKVDFNEKLRAKGTTEFLNLKTEWFFSIDPADQNADGRPNRLFKINDKEINFNSLSEDLHQLNYKNILSGENDFSISNIMNTMEYILDIT